MTKVLAVHSGSVPNDRHAPGPRVPLVIASKVADLFQLYFESCSYVRLFSRAMGLRFFAIERTRLAFRSRVHL
jgi:hypothetical protein